MFGESEWYRIGNLPKTTTLADVCSPDRVPSFSRIEIVDRGQDLLDVIEVKDEHGRRLGALIIAARGEGPKGKLTTHGVSIYTEDEIRDF